ncbi:hypothetical protein ACHAPU_011276 [Fusarium lateritium]
MVHTRSQTAIPGEKSASFSEHTKVLPGKTIQLKSTPATNRPLRARETIRFLQGPHDTRQEEKIIQEYDPGLARLRVLAWSTPEDPAEPRWENSWQNKGFFKKHVNAFLRRCCTNEFPKELLGEAERLRNEGLGMVGDGSVRDKVRRIDSDRPGGEAKVCSKFEEHSRVVVVPSPGTRPDKAPNQAVASDTDASQTASPPATHLFNPCSIPIFQAPVPPADQPDAPVCRPQDLMREGVDGATWDWWSWYQSHQKKKRQRRKEKDAQRRAEEEEVVE